MSEPISERTAEVRSRDPRRRPGELFQRLSRLVRKEVSTILRDRRTIITLVLMPLLLYPLLSIFFRQFLIVSNLGKEAEIVYSVGFTREDDQRIFGRHIALGDDVLESQHRSREELGPPRELRTPGQTYDDLEEVVRRGVVDLGVQILTPARDRDINRNRERALDLEIYYNPERAQSLDALAYVERRLDAAHRQLLYQRRFPGRGEGPVVLLRPFRKSIQSEKEDKQSPLQMVIPLILILMTITGAVYPAIDLTAGERERGTLEILVAAPVPRLGLLFAKYVSVVTVSVLTAVVNLVTMAGTLMITGLGPLVFGEAGLRPLAIVQLFLLLLLFAVFFSAVLLAVTSFARSFKEAQAYLIPLMVVSLMPGVASVVGLKLDGPIRVVPLLNIVLLTRDIFTGTATTADTILVVLSTLVYSLAAIAAAARIFGAEAVLYNEQAGWSDLFRRPSRGRDTPLLSSALFCLALMFPTWFVLTGLLAQFGDMGPLTEMMMRAAAGVLLFLAFPLVSAWMRRVRFPSAFRLERSGLSAWVPAVLFGLSLWVFVPLLNDLLGQLQLSTLNELLMGGVEKRLELWRSLPLPVVLMLMAVTPAILEELFFRGYLFSALRSGSRPRSAIFGSAAFFGLFHLVSPQVLVVEWGVTSFLLGLILGWVSWRSGSVVPGMILHSLHNSCVVMLGYFKPVLEREGWIGADQNGLPETWLLAAGAACVVAVVWMVNSR